MANTETPALSFQRIQEILAEARPAIDRYFQADLRVAESETKLDDASASLYEARDDAGVAALEELLVLFPDLLAAYQVTRAQFDV